MIFLFDQINLLKYKIFPMILISDYIDHKAKAILVRFYYHFFWCY